MCACLLCKSNEMPGTGGLSTALSPSIAPDGRGGTPRGVHSKARVRMATLRRIHRGGSVGTAGGRREHMHTQRGERQRAFWRHLKRVLLLHFLQKGILYAKEQCVIQILPFLPMTSFLKTRRRGHLPASSPVTGPSPAPCPVSPS